MLEAICAFSVMMSVTAWVLAIWAVIEMRSMQKSTHSVQLMPVDEVAKQVKPKDFYKEDFDNIE